MNNEEQILNGLNESQKKAIQSYGQPIQLLSSAGSGKCNSENTRIHTNLGYLQIKNLSKFTNLKKSELNQGNFYDFTKEVLVRDNQISDKLYVNGVVDTIKIKSVKFDFEATPNHPIRVLDRQQGVIWKQMQDLKIGDHVCVDSKVNILFNLETPKPSFLKHLSEFDYGWFVGFFMGDGYLGIVNDKPSNLGFTKLEQIIDYIKDQLIPNVKWNKRKDTRSKVTFYIDYHSVNSCKELFDLGIKGKSFDKELPEWVYDSNEDFLRGLLSGYLDSDGYGVNLEIVSKSENLARGMRDIFNLFGIYPSLTDKWVKYKGEKRKYFKLSFFNIDNEKLRILDLKVDYKKQQLQNIIDKDNYNTNNQKVLFTEPYKKELLDLYLNDIKKNIPYSSRGKEMSIIKESKQNRRDYFTKYSWDYLKTKLQKKTLENSVMDYDLTNYEFIPIESISNSQSMTYDISVPTTNTYTANGIVSHNTSVLTRKVVHMNKVYGVPIQRILAITFTNKASKEMKERLSKYLNCDIKELKYVSTFHSFCHKVLQGHYKKLGYLTDNVNLCMDSDIRNICKTVQTKYKNLYGISTDFYTVDRLKSSFSLVKLSNNFNEGLDQLELEHLSEMFYDYQRELRKSSAIDFDDLLLLSVRLFETYPDILELWQNRFDYFLVDEFQDTNSIQYQLLKLITAKNKHNVLVVGDIFQSIYSFRGAKPENVKMFELEFPNTLQIKMTKNYRSTQNIINLANKVVHATEDDENRQLFLEMETDNSIGKAVTYNTYSDENVEAYNICNYIRQLHNSGVAYDNMVILLRTMFLSRVLESKLSFYRIPYIVVNGQNFFDRHEIALLLSYLKFSINLNDFLSFSKIINTPSRTIGVKAMSIIESNYTTDWLDACRKSIPQMRPDAKIELKKFVDIIDKMIGLDPDKNPYLTLKLAIKEIGLSKYLSDNFDNAGDREDNVMELLSLLSSLHSTETFTDYYNDQILSMISKEEDKVKDKIKIMTIHGSKGLEFPVVFLPAIEDDILPYVKTQNDPTKIEEERRLFYVAITRAKSLCFISNSEKRLYNNRKKPSRFLNNLF